MKCKTKIQWGGYSTSLLSRTDAMSCWSLSLPAGKDGACPLSVYGENSICGTCYAKTNRFNQPNVLTAQTIRFNWLKHHIKKDNLEYLIGVLHKSIEQHSSHERYFRWFDSGDFFHPDLIYICHEVCKNLPKIKFWFPTRVWHVKSDNWQLPLNELSKLKNVMVRPSALFLNDMPPDISPYMYGTSVITNENNNMGISVCPKTINGGSCESNHCRSCWESEKSIAYLWHGFAHAKSYKPISDSLLEKRKAFITNLTIKGHKYENFEEGLIK